MRVKLIQADLEQDCLINKMYIAARTCYSNKSPIELESEVEYKDLEKKFSLIKEIIASGHQSIAEHVQFTFAIEGISRACSHQLVRHRHCTFSQMSQRYTEIKEDLQYLKQLYKETKSEDDVERLEAVEKVCEIVDKYFVVDEKIGAIKYFFTLIDYLQAIQNGCKPEEARSILPNATRTNLVMSVNLRELIHICHLRLCSRAQTEIRILFNEIKNEIRNEYPLLAEFLHPSCESLGYCPEARCCGKFPKKEEIIG